ncbi:hypothetical protein [Frigoriglobus tundricola]|uniref:Bacterial Ig-like domain-containing protein n=1 Tax=Frigoriglobus tundricola TaxID=2774151 RepID=A0A6M5YSZ2_9BACT|nr:hypothetical protein [Frigoriglobus tundricola]QJW96979.1 hypothetical protein FTUN_4539 [Frigoriglobus tundricola]
MSIATIRITSPIVGGSVNRPFVASGSFTFNGTPTISVVLQDTTGATVATGTTPQLTGLTWSSTISPTQALTGACVFAQITGTNAKDTVGSITVN